MPKNPRTENQPLSSKKHLLCCTLLICMVTAAAFFPSLHNGFTNWDDPSYVTENPVITAPTAENFRAIFSTPFVSNYHPLTMLVYMLEFRLFGLNPAGYHAVNLLLHLGCAVLVFLLAVRLSGKMAIGLVAALLFSIHPLRVESVAWVSELKDVLSGFFYLLSLALYLSFAKGRSKRAYVLSVFSFLAALLAKPMAVSLPFILPLIDWFVNRKPLRRGIVEKLPFFALGALFALVALVVQNGSGAVHDYPSAMLLKRLCVPFYGALFYIVKSIFPFRLSAIYPFPFVPDPVVDAAIYASPFAVVALVILIVRYRGRLGKTAVFAALFYGITVLPVLQIVPIGVILAADRYSYIPLVGGALAGAALFHKLLVRRRGPAIAIAGALLIVLSCLTFQRCMVWRDSFALWNDVIGKHPATAIQAYSNRALAYCTAGDFTRAVDDFSSAIAIKPDYAGAYGNRGAAFERLGVHDRALADFNRALALDPADTRTLNNRGMLFENQGAFEPAIADFTRLLALDPRNGLASNERGIAYGAAGKYDSAIADFSRAIELDPGNGNALTNRGLLFFRSGNYQGAVEDLSAVLRLDRAYAQQAYAGRGAAYVKLGRCDRALSDLDKAVELNGADGFAQHALQEAVSLCGGNYRK